MSFILITILVFLSIYLHPNNQINTQNIINLIIKTKPISLDNYVSIPFEKYNYPNRLLTYYINNNRSSRYFIKNYFDLFWYYTILLFYRLLDTIESIYFCICYYLVNSRLFYRKTMNNLDCAIKA